MLFKTIVVGTDFSACSQPAEDTSERLIRAAPNGELIMVHALEFHVYPGAELSMLDMLTPLQDFAGKQMSERIRRLEQLGIRARGVVTAGPAWECIIHAAQSHPADLIVVGTHGHQGLKHAVLGSVAEKVVRMSPVPVLTVRGAGT